MVKRLQAAAALHSQTANRTFRAYVVDPKQEAKKIPVADRVRNTPVKEHTIDITTARLFLRDAELQSRLVATVETATVGQLRWGGTGGGFLSTAWCASWWAPWFTCMPCGANGSARAWRSAISMKNTCTS